MSNLINSETCNDITKCSDGSDQHYCNLTWFIVIGSLAILVILVILWFCRIPISKAFKKCHVRRRREDSNIDLEHVRTEFTTPEIMTVETKNKTKIGDESTCNICFEPRENTSWGFLPCGHFYFCKSCCEQVLQRKRECPICRRYITEMRQIWH